MLLFKYYESNISAFYLLFFVSFAFTNATIQETVCFNLAWRVVDKVDNIVCVSVFVKVCYSSSVY